MLITLHDQEFILLPQKAMYWKSQEAILIADAHFGKATHFRKHGIYISEKPFENDLEILFQLITEFKPKKILFLGDMFHSLYNEECVAFKNLIDNFPFLQTILIKGNHDILKPVDYEALNIQLINRLLIDGVLIVHEQSEVENKAESKKKVETYGENPITSQIPIITICGHIHPAYELKGRGRQHIRLACFHLSNQIFTLPAFGSFTGHHSISPQEEDNVFIISGTEILKIN